MLCLVVMLGTQSHITDKCGGGGGVCVRESERERESFALSPLYFDEGIGKPTRVGKRVKENVKS